jgi:hypothetical protein
MRSSEREFQRHSGEFRPMSLYDTHEWETRPQEEEQNASPEDDASYDAPRPGSSAIRRSRIPTAPRSTTTSAQGVPMTPRRASSQRLPTGTIAPASLAARNGRKRPDSLLHNLLKGRVHWLLPLGIGMIAMLVLWEVGTLAVSWGRAEYNNLTYGSPRTYQTDFVVGHDDSPQHPSHFIAINLNHQAIVIEFPGGNPQNAKSYVVPYYILGQNSNLVPVTVTFEDVNGDGKPDMIVHIHLQSQDQTFVFINTGKAFRAPTSSDHIHLSQ